MAVYLIHFNERYRHAGHYLGYSSDLAARIRAHRESRGARLMEVVNAVGINWRVVRIWPDGGYDLERALKARHNGARLCPVCNPAVGEQLVEDVGMEEEDGAEWMSAEVFERWLAGMGEAAAVGWPDEPLDGPLEWWLDGLYGGQWQVDASRCRWRGNEREPWQAWHALPPWAVVLTSVLYEWYDNGLVSAGQVQEALGWSLAALGLGECP